MKSAASLSLIADLPKQLKEKLYAIGKKKNYRSGQLIHQEGDKTASLSIVLTGSVKISRLHANGKEVVAVLLTSTETFGEHPLFAGTPRTHDATAVSDVSLIEISKYNFFRLMDNESELRDHMLRALAFRIIRASGLLDDERRHPVLIRVAKFLIAQCYASDHLQKLHLTQTNIAEALDISRMSVNTALKQLKETGLVESSYGSIKVPNINKLREWINSQAN